MRFFMMAAHVATVMVVTEDMEAIVDRPHLILRIRVAAQDGEAVQALVQPNQGGRQQVPW